MQPAGRSLPSAGLGVSHAAIYCCKVVVLNVNYNILKQRKQTFFTNVHYTNLNKQEVE